MTYLALSNISQLFVDGFGRFATWNLIRKPFLMVRREKGRIGASFFFLYFRELLAELLSVDDVILVGLCLVYELN